MRLADLVALNAARAARRPVALVSDLKHGALRLVDAAEVAQDPLGPGIGERMRSGRSGPVSHGGEDFFVDVHMPPVRLLLVGAVHISQALAPMAAATGFDVTIVDPRTAFASVERFPASRLLAEWPDDMLPAYRLDRYTGVALLTHDPRIDDQALAAALRARCFYVGALGSRKTQASRRERMAALGFTPDDLAAIRGPIGLDIGAVSPAEIAVSIIAEMVAALRKPDAAGRAG